MVTKAKAGVIIGAFVIAIIVVGLLLTWRMVGRGFSTRDEPTQIETFLARRVRSLATPTSARDEKNPVMGSEEVLSEAMAHFADHCATCHANDGSGDTAIGKGLYPKPPDLRQSDTQKLTDGELYYIIHNGVRLTGMPAFGEEVSGKPDLDSWKLVHFIRHLPNITPEEVNKMESMNPKSPAELREEEAIEQFLRGEDVEPPESTHKHD
jgi:mono/diheme cytochrome c family protein